MRGRGTSLNFADLASDPPPANLQVAAAFHDSACATITRTNYMTLFAPAGEGEVIWTSLRSTQQAPCACILVTGSGSCAADTAMPTVLNASIASGAGCVPADVRGVAGGGAVRKGHRDTPGALCHSTQDVDACGWTMSVAARAAALHRDGTPHLTGAWQKLCRRTSVWAVVTAEERLCACTQAEIRTRKASIAEKETALAANNPPLFQQIQVTTL
jgi:hypothetical protein